MFHDNCELFCRDGGNGFWPNVVTKVDEFHMKGHTCSPAFRYVSKNPLIFSTILFQKTLDHTGCYMNNQVR
jgi:hypothetical protein